MSDAKEEKCENFDAVRKRFMRHLSAGGNVNALSVSFGALQKNFERVDFVLELLEKAVIDFGFVKDGKSEEMAIKMRESGNEMFKMKKLKEAWEFYTKSVSYADKNGKNLSLAYANRSAVLFEVNLHKQCLKDINLALENNYPDHLKPKLFVREKNSKNLEIEAFGEPHEPVPTLPSENPQIQAASDCLEIREDVQSGRHVVATRDIEIGEVLAVEKPFVSLVVSQLLNHCHHCSRLCYGLIPCEGCTEAMYCSAICRERAFDSYHRFECSILATLRALQLDKLKFMALKIALSAREEYSSLEITEKEKVYKSDRYREIHELITNVQKRSVPDLFERATAAAAIFNLVKNRTDFFKDSDEEFQKKFKDVLLLHMQTGPSNFHELTELAPNSAGVYEPQEVASGAFAFLSLLNHSCSPNVTRFCHGTVIVLRAIQSIKKGQQLFDNYGYHYALTDKAERQKQLKKQYYFDCSCPACQMNWSKYDSLPVAEVAEVDDSIMEKLSSADVDAAEEVLKESLDKLRELEDSIPCKNFCQVQEVVKQCYAIFGNKRRLF